MLLDPSLQGWTRETFRSQEQIEILRDIEDRDLGGLSSRQKPAILLGYYQHDPRCIVLFPNAIQLVAERKGWAVDVLTRVVLIHELAHWFTLDGTRNRFGGTETGLWPNESTKPSEYAETLAELVSWLVFNTVAAENMPDAREHLRQQYLLNDPSTHYSYQLYWFWLVAAGVARGLNDLRGECAGLANSPGTKHLHKWIRGGGFHGDLLTPGCRSEFLKNLCAGKELLIEGFNNPYRELHDRFDAWEAFLRNRDDYGGGACLGILDI